MMYTIFSAILDKKKNTLPKSNKTIFWRCFFQCPSSMQLLVEINQKLASIQGFLAVTMQSGVYDRVSPDLVALKEMFATAEFMPDDSLGVAKTQDNKVAVFGRYTIEYFQNVATENFAFQRKFSIPKKL